MMKRLNTIFSFKVGMVLAVVVFIGAAAAVALAPRKLNSVRAESCSNPPSVATLNPYPVIWSGSFDTCNDAPAIAIRNVNDSSYGTSASGQAGDEFYVRYYIHNGAATNFDPSQTTAYNVNVSTSISGNTISMSASGNNTNTIGGSVSVNLPSGATLQVVPGSGELYNYQSSLLSSGFTIDNGSYNLGDMAACFENLRVIRFKVKIVGGQSQQGSGSITASEGQQMCSAGLYYGSYTWQTSNVTNVVVKARDNDSGFEQVLSTGVPSGTGSAEWLTPGHHYTFTLTGDNFSATPFNLTIDQLNCGQPTTQVQCSPSNQNAQAGQTVYFSATGGDGNFSWSGNGQSGSGSTFSTVYNQAGSFSVTVNSNGQSATCNVTVQSQPQNNDFTLTTDNNFCVGSQTRYTIVTTSGLLGQSILWNSTFNGQNTGENNYYVGQVVSGSGGQGFWSDVGSTWTTANIGQWTKTATINGISRTVSFEVKNCGTTPPPPAQLQCNPSNQNANVNQTVYFSATGGTGNYTWTANGGYPTGGYGSSFNTSYASGGNKTVTVSDGSSSANCNVAVATPQNPTLQCSPQTQSANPNQPVYFTATGGDGNYSWSTNGGSPSNGNGQSFSTTYSDSGSKQVTVSSGGATANCTVTVNQQPAQQYDFTLTTDNNFCVGQNTRYTITSTANLIGQSILWNSTLNGQNTGENNYYVGQIVSGNGGLGFWSDVGSTWTTANIGQWTKTATINGISRTVSFEVKNCGTTPPPTQTLQCSPSNQNASVNQTVYFTATGGTGNYTWTANGGYPTGGYGSSFNTSYASGGNKTVTVSDGSTTANCNVAVATPQNPTLQCSPQTQSANPNQPVYFTATGGDGNYSWSANGGSPSNGNGQSFSTTYSASGSKQVTVTSGGTTANCNVTVNQQPAQQYDFTLVTDNNFCVGQNTRYTITATANLIGQSILWNSTLNGQNTGENNYYVGQVVSGSGGLGFWSDVGSTWTTANIGHWTKTATINGISRTVSFDVKNCGTTPPPTQTLQCSPSNQNANINQTVYFTATGGTGNYTWTANGGYPTGGYGSSFNTSYASSGAKTVTVSDGSTTANCNVAVATPPTQQVQCSPATQSANPNQPVYFTATGGNGSYTWSATGGSPASGNGQSFSTTYSASGSKQVIVTSSGQSSTCNVTVNQQPAQQYDFTLVTDNNFCVGQNTRYTITATANLIGQSILWNSTLNGQNTGENNYYVGQIISGSGGLGFWSDVGSTWTTANIGHWTKTATINGISRTVSFDVKNCGVTPPPPTQLQCSPSNQNANVNQTVYFTATGGTGNYTWTANGGYPTGGYGSSFNTSYASGGSKTVSVSDGSTTANCNVNVSTPPNPTLQCSPSNQTANQGQPVYFTATGGNGSYSWSANGGSPASGSGYSFSTSYSTSGAKTVTVTSGGVSSNCNVTVNQTPPQQKDFTLTTDNNFCVGQNTRYTIVATANLIGERILWNSTLNGQNTGENNYYVGQIVSGSGGLGFWSDVGSTWTTANIGNWTKTATISGISRTVSFTVRDCTPPVQTLQCSPPSQTVNVGQPVYFTATGGTGAYSWSAPLSSNTSGSGLSFNTSYNSANPNGYIVTVTSGGQTATCKAIVNQPNNPQLICSPASQTAQTGQTVYFSASGGNGTYSWTSTNGRTGSGNTFTNVFNQAGQQTATVTSNGQSQNCTVQVSTPPTQTLQCSPSNQSANVNQTVYFTATGGTGNYTWTANGGYPTGGYGSSFNTSYASGGSKTVTVSDGSTTANCNVNVSTPPNPQQVQCSPASQTANSGQTVYFTATGGNGTYSWTSSNGRTGSGSSFSNVFSGSGQYSATVTSNGQSSICTVQISQQPPVCVINSNVSLTTGAITDMGNGYYQAVIAYSYSGSNPMRLTYVNPDNGQEVVLVQNITVSPGSYTFNQIQANKNYIVKLYDTSSCGALVATLVIRKDVNNQCVVNTNASLTFSTPVQNGNTWSSTLTWSSSGSNQIRITQGTLSNTVITGGPNGTYQVTNMTAGNSYTFYMYDANCNVLLIANTIVIQQYNQPGQLTITKLVRTLNGASYQSSVTVSSGDTVQFQIRVQNPGSQNLTNVRVTDTLPQGLSFVPGTVQMDGTGASDSFGNSGTLYIGNLGSYQSRTITFQARVNSSYTTTTYGQNGIQNIAYAQADNVGQVQASAWVYVGQVQGGNINLTYNKRAMNITKNVDAQSVPASKEDFITYTLTVTNNGNSPATNFVITDDLSGVLPFADMVDYGGGQVNGQVITFPAVTIPAGGSVSKSFQVRVKYFLASNLNYVMTNTYGNTVRININTPQVQGAFIAPKTGADTMALAFGALAMAGFAVYRKRKLLSWLILNN